MSSNKLFVGGLSHQTTGESLRSLFEQYGEVTESRIIMDRETGESRGFGFVTFADSSDADEARENLNGAEVDGRNITVDEARERRNDRGRGGFRGGRGGYRGGRGGGRSGGYRSHDRF
ncbi:MAG: RNA-binding protein [Lentisphaerae bacterium]|nr:MAG: RNA-binding protein [Lentisphaerota bacterium]